MAKKKSEKLNSHVNIHEKKEVAKLNKRLEELRLDAINAEDLYSYETIASKMIRQKADLIAIYDVTSKVKIPSPNKRLFSRIGHIKTKITGSPSTGAFAAINAVNKL